MMQHMMKAGNMEYSGMKVNMQKMMDDPQMKERMQKHMDIMQSIMENGEMNHSKMMEMAGDSSMMNMHMTCMQMMQGNMMDQKGMMKESKKGNKHQQHHN